MSMQDAHNETKRVFLTTASDQVPMMSPISLRMSELKDREYSKIFNGLISDCSREVKDMVLLHLFCGVDISEQAQAYLNKALNISEDKTKAIEEYEQGYEFSNEGPENFKIEIEKENINKHFKEEDYVLAKQLEEEFKSWNHEKDEIFNI